MTLTRASGRATHLPADSPNSQTDLTLTALAQHVARPDKIGPTAAGTVTYEIRVAGYLEDHWAATLENLALTAKTTAPPD